MKIDNILIKVDAKIKSFIRGILGNTRQAYIIIKIVMAFLISLNFYYYISDRGIPKFLVLLCLSLVFYVLISLANIILKRLVMLIKRIKNQNIVIFSIFYGIVYKIVEELSGDGNLEDYQVYIYSLVFVILVFVFAKSLISLTKNKKIFMIFPLILSLVPIVGLSIILIFPFDISINEALDLAQVGKHKIDDKIIYSSNYIEYGNEENPKTISLRSYVNYYGNKKKIRDKYFGYTLSNVPIKGRVWYPQNKIKAPVIFLVHGNHRFTEENYRGYDYLGRYLARRGIALVSIDMNILNGFMKFGLSNENDARAILLLENIKYLLNESKKETSKFYNMFDQDRVALAGHSRGGEAAAIAASFNNLSYNPDKGYPMDYNFNIKALACIAPTEGQYKPSDKRITIKDINFLTIHGSHDNDVEGFDGMILYDNVKFSQDSNNFKSALYLGYANHGQFNSRWSSYDDSPPFSYFINTHALIKEEEQEEILCKYLYVFLQNSFGLLEGRNLFINPKDYELPKTIYYSRYEDASFENLCDFEEDYDLTTFKYGKTKFENLSSIYETEKSIGNSDVSSCLNLKFSSRGTYELMFDESPNTKKYLQMDIMNNQKLEFYEDINFKINIIDTYGNKAGLDICDYVKLYPKLRIEKSKLQYINKDYDYNGSYQTLRIPLIDFMKNSSINLDEIRYINFDFKDSSGSISIDNIGFSN